MVESEVAGRGVVREGKNTTGDGRKEGVQGQKEGCVRRDGRV